MMGGRVSMTFSRSDLVVSRFKEKRMELWADSGSWWIAIKT